MAHGWWADEAVARGKWLAWIGEHSRMPDAAVVLVDEAEQQVLAAWPQEE